MGDSLQTLPTDQQPIDPQEQQLLNTIFKEDASSMTQLFQELRIPLIAGILFLFLSMSSIDNGFKSVVPYLGKSEASMVLFKTILFIGALFFILLMISK
jgi:hypothetical protein